MSWAKIDDQLAFHPKIIKAGNEATGAWLRMLALSCAQLTDGKITAAVALSITRIGIVERLVECELLDAFGRDYAIHDFHDWNPPAEQVKAKREEDRKRKALGRANQSRDENGRISGRIPIGRPDGRRSDSERRPPVPSPSPSPEKKEIRDPSKPPVGPGPLRARATGAGMGGK